MGVDDDPLPMFYLYDDELLFIYSNTYGITTFKKYQTKKIKGGINGSNYIKTGKRDSEGMYS